jgi:hypothetical protein
MNSLKKNTDALLAVSKVSLEVNTEETKYVVIFREQNAEQNSNIKERNKSFERMSNLKYLGAKLTNQNASVNTFKSRLNSGNICYNLVQIFSHFLSKKHSFKNMLTYNFVCCFILVSMLFLYINEEYQLKVFKNVVLR